MPSLRRYLCIVQKKQEHALVDAVNHLLTIGGQVNERDIFMATTRFHNSQSRKGSGRKWTGPLARMLAGPGLLARSEVVMDCSDILDLLWLIGLLLN